MSEHLGQCASGRAELRAQCGRQSDAASRTLRLARRQSDAAPDAQHPPATGRRGREARRVQCAAAPQSRLARNTLAGRASNKSLMMIGAMLRHVVPLPAVHHFDFSISFRLIKWSTSSRRALCLLRRRRAPSGREWLMSGAGGCELRAADCAVRTAGRGVRSAHREARRRRKGQPNVA